MCHSMCHSMSLTKPHEEGYCVSIFLIFLAFHGTITFVCHQLEILLTFHLERTMSTKFLWDMFWNRNLTMYNRPIHVLLWGSLSGTLSGTLRIVFQSHLVLCASMRLIVRNNFSFCFLHYFSNFSQNFDISSL